MIGEWLAKNYQWVFSGIGVFALGLLITGLQVSKRKRMKQKVSNHSTGIQAGRDVNIDRDR